MISGLPKQKGSYRINDQLNFSFYKKPNWFHRKMTRFLLGWEWIDYDFIKEHGDKPLHAPLRTSKGFSIEDLQ